MRINVLVTPREPWFHAIYQQDGEHDPNKTLCGIVRKISREFYDTNMAFLDLRESNIDSEHVCGVCWYIYCMKR